MKPKHTLEKFQVVAPSETLVRNSLWLLIVFFTILFGSCKKDMNDASTSKSNTEDALALQPAKPGASVATDWYKLQLRFLLKKNSSLTNGVFFWLYRYWFIRSGKKCKSKFDKFFRKTLPDARNAINRQQQKI
ncbi:hypothetical protein FRZ67_20880 [Panacibacter ginsenosidivorans]|uniref:Uncharacterized protein n=1 Tax=Panacibacter ginsenosidivorans TaxID=1813871 RepID=A0A5B8VGD5_9BACT|nr:hypothetical protein [Panacibacter ginsenosidivorans]QEC69636.1 hypothetical protein FRZ67_20880 [Panacibacter ginsenosidivorans]